MASAIRRFLSIEIVKVHPQLGNNNFIHELVFSKQDRRFTVNGTNRRNAAAQDYRFLPYEIHGHLSYLV